MSAGRFRILLIVLTLAVIAALLPLDGPISRSARDWSERVGGDIRRELKTYEQYGQLGSIVLVSLVIWLIDERRRRRLVDFWLAAGAAFGACIILKALIGRARPTLDQPDYFVLPWQTYVGSWGRSTAPPLHAWQLFHKDAVEIWSMPSSHTALAMVMSLMLIRFYPKIKPVAIGMLVLVGFGRVWFGDHYPTDVVAGALVGYLAGQPILDKRGAQARPA